MSKIKEELKKEFENGIERGLSKEEALSQAIINVRKNHSKEAFEPAAKSFIEEILKSYSVENLTEEDPLMALADAIYLEAELILPKIKSILKIK